MQKMIKFKSQIDPIRKIYAIIPVYICIFVFCISFVVNINDPLILRFPSGIGCLIFFIQYLGLFSCNYFINSITIEYYILGFNVKSIVISEIIKIQGKIYKQVIYGNSRDTINLVLKNGNEIAISPLDKDGFITQLTNINKNIVVDFPK